MSAEGPESIPTSADPRSRRATKKRALTPVSAQAASVDALFARPDQEIRIPSSSAVSRLAAPPEIVTHVQGSSSGAGSGEFHVYKAARRREYERLREMDEQVRREQEQVDFDKEKAERVRKDEERTKKNRERRDKMKARKAKKGKGGPTSSATKAAAQNGNGITEHNEEEERPHDHKQDDTDGQEVSSGKSAEPVGLVIHDDE